MYCSVIFSSSMEMCIRDRLKDLFIRYRQISGVSGLNRDYSGSGIGLHYTKTLVESHKGGIRAHLKPEKGMEFSFVIPARDVYSALEMCIRDRYLTWNIPLKTHGKRACHL